MYFGPSHRLGTKCQIRSNDGEPIAVDDVLLELVPEDEVEPAPQTNAASPELIDAIDKATRVQLARRFIGGIPGAPEGERNNTIYRAAFAANDFAVDLDDVMPAVLELAKRCDPPYPENEAKTAAEHAHRYAKAGKGWRLARYAPVPDRVDEEDLKRVIKNLKQRKSTNLQSQGRLLAAMKKGEIINLAEMQIAARTLAEEFSNADAEQLAGFFAKAFEKPSDPQCSVENFAAQAAGLTASSWSSRRERSSPPDCRAAPAGGPRTRLQRLGAHEGGGGALRPDTLRVARLRDSPGPADLGSGCCWMVPRGAAVGALVSKLLSEPQRKRRRER